MQSFGTSKITLTPKEQEIFDLFQQFVKAKQLNTTLRVSGGWVRDKLLGRESHDIDLALDNMMGADFVQKMNEYLTQGGTEKASGFGVTKFNPDKSKHLETACVKIRDVWIDVVNLRGETYAEDSRIPTMSFGTPLEDAERRDLTINSLFYNINEGTVEDFTGKGIADLQMGIIRTPLEPVRTFLDDPLRVLRTFRFAARFGYKIVPEIYEALQIQSVKENLMLKVSRERVGIELTSMLHNQNVFQALSEFYRNGLWHVIFYIPDKCTCDNRNETNQLSFQICERVSHELKRADTFYVLRARVNESNLTYFAFLSAICFPFNRYTYQQSKNHQPLSSYILLESLKLPKKETQQVQQIIESAMKFKFFDNFEEQFDQIVAWIQEAGFCWELSLLIWFCSQSGNQNFPEEFRQFVYQRQLETFFDEKPLLNGGEVTSLLGIPPGPGIKSVLNRVLLLQARDRKITKEMLVIKLKEVK